MDLRRTSGIICGHRIVRINTRPCSQRWGGIKQYPNLGEINRLCVYLYYHSKSTYSVNWTSLIKQWTQSDSRKTMPIHRCDGTVTLPNGARWPVQEPSSFTVNRCKMTANYVSVHLNKHTTSRETLNIVKCINIFPIDIFPIQTTWNIEELFSVT